jgi:hypothetical protein
VKLLFFSSLNLILLGLFRYTMPCIQW